MKSFELEGFTFINGAIKPTKGYFFCFISCSLSHNWSVMNYDKVQISDDVAWPCRVWCMMTALSADVVVKCDI